MSGTDKCGHPVNHRNTAIKETWFEVVTTVTCGNCGGTVSETRVRKIQPTDPGTGGKPPK